MSEQNSNHEAEMCVIGCIFIDAAAAKKCQDMQLLPQHFDSMQNAVLYRETMSLRCNEDFSTSSLMRHLKGIGFPGGKDGLTRIGGMEKLVDVMESVPSAEHVEDYARIVLNWFDERCGFEKEDVQ